MKRTKLEGLAKEKNGRTETGRVAVSKTYKLFIGGKFPRTESGRYTPLHLQDGRMINVCQASRKDLRNAVVAARKQLGDWSGRTAYNRGQILYRIAEMLEGRKDQFVSDLCAMGMDQSSATEEVIKSIDCIIYFAGWCDKYLQIFSSVNPVSTSHFNFSAPEPVGVVGIVVPEKIGMVSFVNQLMAVLTGANTAVVVVPEELALAAITFAEVVHTSDVPAGVINILTGSTAELLPHLSSHMDINGLIYCGSINGELQSIQETGADHVLRVASRTSEEAVTMSPYHIMDMQEIKTTWHPIGK